MSILTKVLARPRSYRVLVIEHGAKPGLIARKLADVVVQGEKPNHWRVVKNRTGKQIVLKP